MSLNHKKFDLKCKLWSLRGLKLNGHIGVIIKTWIKTSLKVALFFEYFEIF